MIQWPFNTSTMLYNHHCFLVSKYFHHSKIKHFKQLFPIWPFCWFQTLPTTNLLTVYTDLSILDISCKWNWTICDLCVLTVPFSKCFLGISTLDNVSVLHFFFYNWIIFYCLLTHMYIFSLLLLLLLYLKIHYQMQGHEDLSLFSCIRVLYLNHLYLAYESEVPQSCPTLCDSMDCSLPGFSVHGIFQARVL